MDKPRNIEVYKDMIWRYVRATGTPMRKTPEEFWQRAYDLNLSPEMFFSEKRKYLYP